MKTLLTTTTVLLLHTISFAQKLVVSKPAIIKWPSSQLDTSLNVYLVGTSDTFKLTVSYKGEGKAEIGKDFDFTTQVFDNVVNHQSFNVTIKKSQDIKRKKFVLDVLAKGKDTILKEKIEVVLIDDPDWEVKHPVDPSNTAKFEFVNYTDFKGFDQDAPNGIAQSQFLFKIPVNHRMREWRDGSTYTQWFRSLVLPNFLFNRIDKTDKGVTQQLSRNNYGDSSSYSRVISSFDFITNSNFILNTKLAIFTLMKPHSRVQLQLNGSVYKIKVDSMEVTGTSPMAGDSVSKVSIGFNTVYATGLGAELFYDTKYTEEEFPFNFRFIASVQWIKMRSGDYIQADVAPTLPDNSRKSAIMIDPNTGKSSAPIFTFSAMIKKNLNLKKSDSEDHYLFFRYNYSWQRFKAGVPITNRPGMYETKRLYNNFSQFQLGLDLNFDSFFKN